MAKVSTKPKPWVVQFKYGEPHRYQQSSGAITYVVNQIDELMDWCRRYNNAGLVVLDDLKAEVGDIDLWFMLNPEKKSRSWDVCFDGAYAARVKFEIRKEAL